MKVELTRQGRLEREHMRDNLTYLVLLLDKSGSMSAVTDATIEGTNSFINKQKQQPGEAVLHVVQFDDVLETSHNYVDLKKAPLLNHYNYVPRGGTALLDAIGRTIDAVGMKLASLPESERPGKVIFLIQTDGAENRSRNFTYEQIQDKIKHQTDVYKWDFVFLGANQDAIASASSIGISAGKSLSYTGTSIGTQIAFNTLESYTSTTRGVKGAGAMKSVTFSQADRDANKLP
jgi:uncharacterized protein YegL